MIIQHLVQRSDTRGQYSSQTIYKKYKIYFEVCKYKINNILTVYGCKINFIQVPIFKIKTPKYLAIEART